MGRPRGTNAELDTSHAILSLEGCPGKCCSSVTSDELIHIVFWETIDVESIPVSTDGINDVICVAVCAASVIQ